MKTYCSDIWNDHNFEFVPIGLEEFSDVLSFALRAYGTSDGVTLLKEGAYNPNGDETVGTSDKNLLARSDSRHD